MAKLRKLDLVGIGAVVHHATMRELSSLEHLQVLGVWVDFREMDSSVPSRESFVALESLMVRGQPDHVEKALGMTASSPLRKLKLLAEGTMKDKDLKSFLDRMQFVNGVFFGYNGLPRIERVPIQTFAMGRGHQVPHVASVFRTPAPTDYLVVKMQRTGTTFVVHFPIQPRPGLRAHSPGNVLVCRATGAFEGYADCDLQDAPLARIAAGFALAHCRSEPPTQRTSDHVLVHEPRSAIGGV
ncbi:hypothetical protein C8T65DRAFT_727303 [Cerioporus squamosus]|nr:hypothetical protein C8T65DRAFT_732854 [Cerioporus squamosus]KAI0710289.1 hypothetical protein C8T65DRAFT_727303 [Cerioporus squamosus]